MPGVWNDVQEFLTAHELCGKAEKMTTGLTVKGYNLYVTCPCGDRLTRRVTPADARHDLIHTSLLASRN